MIKIYEVYLYGNCFNSDENDSFWLKEKNAIKRVEQLRKDLEGRGYEINYIEHDVDDSENCYIGTYSDRNITGY